MGQRWNTLVYASLGRELPHRGALRSSGYELNLASHYVIPRNKTFLGVELYQYQNGPQCDRLIRPQVRIALKNNLLIGLVGNLPLSGAEGPSSFIRLIYEPRQR